MKRRQTFRVIAFVIALSIGSVSQAKQYTNYEVLSAQTDTLARSIINVLVDKQIKLLGCRVGKNDIDNFVRQRIEEHLLEHNLRLVTDSAALTYLKVTVPLVGVAYSSPVSSHIFGSSEVVRTIRSDYDVELTDSGQVAFAKSFSFVYSDTVKEDQISELESGSYDFLHGRSDPGGFFDTMLQPILFVASAVIIVYLFFTLRGS